MLVVDSVSLVTQAGKTEARCFTIHSPTKKKSRILDGVEAYWCCSTGPARAGRKERVQEIPKVLEFNKLTGAAPYTFSKVKKALADA
jgi:hypothetical protein